MVDRKSTATNAMPAASVAASTSSSVVLPIASDTAIAATPASAPPSARVDA